MKITSAKVEYRERLSYGEDTAQFCDVTFDGFRAEEMESKWQAIKVIRYNQYNAIYKQNETTIKSLRDSASAIRDRVKKSKPIYRFWYNSGEQKLLAYADHCENQLKKLEKENEAIGHRRFYSAEEAQREVEQLLRENGFALTHMHCSGSDFSVKTKVWMLEE